MKIDNTPWNLWVQRNTSLSRNTSSSKGMTTPPAGLGKNDRVVLSQQILALLENTSKLQQMEQTQREAESASQKDMLDTLSETMKIMKTCNLIASRVMAGDKVPMKDLKYLMEHDIKGYQLAMAMRRQKAKPKEWKSAIPQEEKAAQQASESSQTQDTGTPAVESSEGSSSSGDSTSSGESSGGEA